MEQEYVHVLCLPDTHYERVVELVNETDGNVGIKLKDNKDVSMTFYFKDDKLYADKENECGEIIQTQEVIKMSDIENKKNERPDFKTHLLNQLKTDFPGMNQDEIESNADILNEANESIKKLILSGIQPKIALKLIYDVLSDNINFSDKSPEDIAEYLKERNEVYNQEE